MSQICTFFMLLKATAHWRDLSADAQRAEFDQALDLVFNGYPQLRMSRYNAAALNSRCTDVIVWETDDAAQYHDAIEALHARPFFGMPLFEIIEVIASVQDPCEQAESSAEPFGMSLLAYAL